MGELYLSDQEIEELKDNPLSKTVLLNDYRSLLVSRVFLQIPFEYSAMGPVGKKYEAIKDFLKWNDLEVKYWTPIVLRMGEVWVNNLTTQ